MAKMTENEIGERVIGAAMKVHSALGPGLLESAYEACLAHELDSAGLSVRQQVALPIVYGDLRLDAGYRLDLLVNSLVVVELKAVEKVTDVHGAQLLSYLKLGRFRLGYVMNFNVLRLRDGLVRMVNGL